MKRLTTKAFEEIRTWVYRNARQIELTLWQYEFENGSKEAVLSALSLYQNEDGGFGNALEPDSWNPKSSPYTTLNAIEVLDTINFSDLSHPIMRGIFKFLESGKHSFENGWVFSIPSNDNYPHAPWWTYNLEANEYESIGVTTGIAGFLLKHADKDSALYKKVFMIAEKMIEMLNVPGNYGEMGVGGFQTLKDLILRLGLGDRFDMEFISNTVKRLVNETMERDINKWAYHCKPPSSFISSPDSEFYTGNEEIMQKELDYIIDTRHKNGVWDIDWSWFENNDKYPKEFAISENWWKAGIVRGKIKLLRNFGRIEEI